jgi:hypothetical protein
MLKTHANNLKKNNTMQKKIKTTLLSYGMSGKYFMLFKHPGFERFLGTKQKLIHHFLQ